MIRAVPPKAVKNYCIVMLLSWWINIMMIGLFFGATIAPLGLLLLTLVTDYSWWRAYKNDPLR